jgi:RimJ/RimL family protein N-acetyltransferase
MPQQPTTPQITTPRLLLRPFRLADAEPLTLLINDPDIANVTANIPHPYSLADAHNFIAKQATNFPNGDSLTLVITHRLTGDLIGGIGLDFDQEIQSPRTAELGYWIAKIHWRQGYCTEAASAAIHFGFHTMGLEHIRASHLARNPASGRVMQKIGMHFEKTVPQTLPKSNRVEDITHYSITCPSETRP